jgi:hypothetical protein
VFRPSCTAALVGASVLMVTLGPAAAATAAMPPDAAFHAAASLAHDPTPAASLDSMPGMVGGAMPGMPDMPGRVHDHEDAPVSRPVAWVIGTFVVVNGLMMAAAAVLRRYRPVRSVTRRPRAAAI